MKVVLILLVSLGLTRAAELFDQGNAAYDDGRFAAAVKCYEQLLERDGPRVAVLQNLGSAYHRLGQDGRAILAFERALLLDPRDPDLQANLDLVRKDAAVFAAETEGGWRQVVTRWSRRQWSWLALAGALLLPIASLGWLALRRRVGRRWMIPVGALGLVLTGGSLVALRMTAGQADCGVILAEQATLRISPFEEADPRGTLRGGRIVRLGRERGGWWWIEAEDRAIEGWVSRKQVAPLIPER